MDDDTRLPPEMVFDEGFFGRESVKAVCYPIRAIGPRDPGDESILVKWQELEYKICDYSKRFQSRFSTVLYPHGAVSLWERETLINCLRDHDTVFYGDDVKMGLWLQHHNYKMIMDHRYLIDTESHITWSGLYEQRGEYTQSFRGMYNMGNTHPTSLIVLTLILQSEVGTWQSMY